ADDDISHAGRSREKRASFLLRDTPGNRDDRIVAVLGRDLPELAEPGVQLLFRALAYAARVDDDDVRVELVARGLETCLLEQTGHSLRVVHVHLAAERFNQIFARHAGLMVPVEWAPGTSFSS